MQDVLTYVSKVHSERAQIRYHPRGQKHITGDPVISLSQHPRRFSPAVFLATQSSYQFFGSVQLLLADQNVGLQFFLLVGHCVKFVVQCLKFINNLRKKKKVEKVLIE